jgi:hypothetical protein
MDWFLEGDSPVAASELRAEIGSFLRRHAADPDEAWTAELAVAELIANAVEHAGGPVWATVDWGEVRPARTCRTATSATGTARPGRIRPRPPNRRRSPGPLRAGSDPLAMPWRVAPGPWARTT